MFFNTQDKFFWENSQTTNLQDKTNMKPIAERKTVPNLDYFEDNPFLLHTKETFNLLLQDEYNELFQITEEIKNTKEELQQKGSKLGRSPIMNKKIKSILKEQFQSKPKLMLKKTNALSQHKAKRRHFVSHLNNFKTTQTSLEKKFPVKLC